jgi:NAD kinase
MLPDIVLTRFFVSRLDVPFCAQILRPCTGWSWTSGEISIPACCLSESANAERFVFGPDDIVVTFGQDGLVANVAKYLDGQTVVGVNPTPGENAGVLARFRVDEVGKALKAAAAHEIRVELRVMAEARLDNGERLLALNEIFVGHRSHQSARYVVKAGEMVER